MRRSIFLKLFIIVFVFGALINVLVMASFRYAFSPQAPLRELVSTHLRRYADSLVVQIGQPPNREKGLALSRELKLDVRTEGPAASWSTDDLPPIRELRQARWKHWTHLHPRAGVEIGHHGERMFLLVERNGQQYAFFTPGGAEFQIRWKPVLFVLLSLLTLTIAATYLVLRKLLQPLRGLDEGVKAIGRGDLAHVVPVKSTDELGSLAASFNQMTGQIRAMLHAREQLLLDISHELRSPLTRIKVALEFLPAGKPRQSIEEDIGDLDRMIGEILESTRLENVAGGLRKDTVDLVPILRSLHDRYQNREPGVSLGGLPSALPIQGDADRIKTVLVNLLENALKYSRASGKPVELAGEVVSNEAQIQIRDYGPGLPPDELEHVFEPFYRVDKSRAKDTGGFGLGLSLCRKIMRAHGGDVTLEPAPGGGLIARVRFPAPQEKPS